MGTLKVINIHGLTIWTLVKIIMILHIEWIKRFQIDYLRNNY